MRVLVFNVTLAIALAVAGRTQITIRCRLIQLRQCMLIRFSLGGFSLIPHRWSP
jgi:hypothetical protein